METEATAPNLTPRVGGLRGAVPWVGGSQISPRTKPADILCYRPGDFRAMQKQHESLKAGLPDAKRLEITSLDDKGQSIKLTAWIEEVKRIVEKRGFDTVFRVVPTLSSPTHEVYLLECWGDITLEQVRSFVKVLTDDGDEYDEENLQLSADAMRESIGPQLSARMATITSATTTGPEYFLTIIQHVSYMNTSLVRHLSNKLSALKLRDIPGENVHQLSDQVTNLAREIEGSGQAPADLMVLVSKPYTLGTADEFKHHALGLHSKIRNNTYQKTWDALVTDYNLYYQDLIQSDEYPPAKGSKADQDNTIQAFMAKTEERFTQLQVQLSNPIKGEKGEVVDQNAAGEKKKPNWRTIAPKEDESKEKIIEGVTYKYCGKCHCGKGYWNSGDRAHFTNELRTKKPTEDVNPAEDANKPKANLGYTSEPLSFGFVAMNSDNMVHPKGPGGNYL